MTKRKKTIKIELLIQCNCQLLLLAGMARSISFAGAHLFHHDGDVVVRYRRRRRACVSRSIFIFHYYCWWGFLSRSVPSPIFSSSALHAVVRRPFDVLKTSQLHEIFSFIIFLCILFGADPVKVCAVSRSRHKQFYECELRTASGAVATSSSSSHWDPSHRYFDDQFFPFFALPSASSFTSRPVSPNWVRLSNRSIDFGGMRDVNATDSSNGPYAFAASRRDNCNFQMKLNRCLHWGDRTRSS